MMWSIKNSELFFIQLTFFQDAEKYHGTGAKATEKTFFLNPNNIVSLVEYPEAGHTKITLSTGVECLVTEPLVDIFNLMELVI